MPVVQINGGVPDQRNVTLKKSGTPAQSHVKWITNDANVTYTVSVPAGILGDGQAKSFPVSRGNPSDNFLVFPGAIVKVPTEYSIVSSGDQLAAASPPTIIVEE